MYIVSIQDICEQFNLRAVEGRIAGKSGSITGGSGTFLLFTTYSNGNGTQTVEMLRDAGCSQPYTTISGLWQFNANEPAQMEAALRAIGISKAAMTRVEKVYKNNL